MRRGDGVGGTSFCVDGVVMPSAAAPTGPRAAERLLVSYMPLAAPIYAHEEAAIAPPWDPTHPFSATALIYSIRDSPARNRQGPASPQKPRQSKSSSQAVT